MTKRRNKITALFVTILMFVTLFATAMPTFADAPSNHEVQWIGSSASITEQDVKDSKTVDVTLSLYVDPKYDAFMNGALKLEFDTNLIKYTKIQLEDPSGDGMTFKQNLSNGVGVVITTLNTNGFAPAADGYVLNLKLTMQITDLAALKAAGNKTSIKVGYNDNDCLMKYDGEKKDYYDVADGTSTFSMPTTFTPMTIKLIPGAGYTVGFDMQGHGTQVSNITGVKDDSTITAPTAPTEKGWIFEGWYKEAACTNAWNFTTDKVTDDTTLYAKWTKIPSFDVSFDMQGHGTQIGDVTGVTSGSTITAPTAPTEKGWKFEGWYKEAACTNAWNFATDKVTAATTLYAKWTQVVAPVTADYTVEHYQQNLNDDKYTKVETENKTATIGEPVVVPAKSYKGFTVDNSLSTIDGNAVTGNSVILNGSVIKVYYTRNSYTVSFDGNGNTGGTVPEAMTAKYGANITIPKDVPTKDGYTFDYWKGSVVHPGDTYKVTGNKTFVAQWTKNDAPKDPGTDDTGNKDPKNSKGTGNVGRSVQTGDNSSIGLWAVLAALGLAGTTGAVVARKKENN